MYLLPLNVLKITGDLEGLLKGLTTNFLEADFNAFTDIKGKVIATCIQRKIKSDEIYYAVAASAVDDLLNHLDQYVPYTDAKIEQVDQEVYLANGSTERSLKVKLEDQSIFFCESGKVNAQEIEQSELDHLRIQNKLPLQGLDYQNPFVLEINSDKLVSFEKGCYLGQEVVARVHHLGKPKKKLVRLRWSQDPIDQNVRNSGEVIGTWSSLAKGKHTEVLSFAMIKADIEKIDNAEIF